MTYSIVLKHASHNPYSKDGIAISYTHSQSYITEVRI